MKNIAIIGSGSFGCALAHLLSKKNNIKIWSFKEEEANLINNEHKCMYLNDLKLSENIKCYTNYKDAIENSEIIVLVTPSSVFEKTCMDINEFVTNQEIVIASKGLCNNMVLSEIAKKYFNNVSVISGPSHAEQLVKNVPTFVDFSGNKELIDIFNIDNLKVNYIEDMIGVQLGGALKNIITIAIGIAQGLGYDSNTISYLVTTGLKEITEIGVSIGAKSETFYGLSGLGDLLTTAYSDDSRNKKAGILLSTGKTKEEIKEEIGMVVEGFDNIESAYKISKEKSLNLKIIFNLKDLLDGKIYIDNFIENIF